MALLEVKNLEVAFRTRRGDALAVDGASFSLEAGKTLALVGAPDGKLDFVSEVYTHHSMFGDKLDKEREKYILKTEETSSGVTYTLKADRALCGWTENKPLRLRLSVGDEFVRATGIRLRFLAKWNEYPDMFFWLIP